MKSNYYSLISQLKSDLIEILDSSKYEEICNCSKSEVLLELENYGEYDPLNWLTWMGSGKLPCIDFLFALPLGPKKFWGYFFEKINSILTSRKTYIGGQRDPSIYISIKTWALRSGASHRFVLLLYLSSISSAIKSSGFILHSLPIAKSISYCTELIFTCLMWSPGVPAFSAYKGFWVRSCKYHSWWECLNHPSGTLPSAYRREPLLP